MRTRYLALTAIIALGMLGARSSAQAPPVATQGQGITREDGANLMRTILTIQANRPFGPKAGYGTLSEMLAILDAVRGQITLADDQTASYRNYTIRMTLSADRKRFEISLVPQNGACAMSWFSSEQNVIYAGQALGCPAQ